MPINDRPIFVVGCARSGTTMLQLMLHAHARIAIPPETRFLLEAYACRRDFGDLRDQTRRGELASWIVRRKDTAFGDLGLDPRQTMDEIVAGPPTLGSAIGIVFRAYARRFGKPRWGDKRPAYLANLDALLQLFPDAQIVHIVRDGRDCVASLKETTWHKGGVYQAVADWSRGIDQGWRAAKALGPGSYYEIYYERLVADTEHELRLLCDFLGEAYDPAMTAPDEIASIAVPRYKKWHAQTRTPVTPQRVGTWRERLDPWEIGLCEAAMGRRLAAHGYLSDGRYRAGLGHRLRYVRFGLHGWLSRVKQSLLAHYRQWRPPANLAARLTTAELSQDPRSSTTR